MFDGIHHVQKSLHVSVEYGCWMGAIVENPTDTGCKVKNHRRAIYRFLGLVKRGQVNINDLRTAWSVLEYE